jgi:serine/threonine protein kinase
VYGARALASFELKVSGKEPLVLGGRFKVLSHLGGGGMSEVYLAEQISLGRKVALKVLKKDLGKRPDMAERFKREARLLSTVDHPSVVRVIDFESAPEATVLVLELVEGVTLERVLRDGAMTVERATPLMIHLVEGLRAIHERGIIHRDVKPQNVVIASTPRGELARLLDFGIARLMEIPDSGDGELPLGGPDNPFVSQPGQVVGTPAYVAPEQATAQPLDARTDIYAFGVVAYRMLSGQFPFPGPSSNDFLKQHLKMPPRPLKDAAPALAAHPKLSALVMKCLEKKPDARWSSAEELAQALRDFWPGNPYDSAVQTPSRKLAGVSAGSLAPVAEKTQAALQKSVQLSKQGLERTVHVARSLDREWWTAIAISVVFAAIAPSAWALWPPTPAERAAEMIQRGSSTEALKLIDARMAEAPEEIPELSALEAAALHRLDRHEQERAWLREYTYRALHSAHPLLLESLAEDFGAQEDDAELRELIRLVPHELMQPQFMAFASEAPSPKQWGALRYLDFHASHEGLDRVELYGRALGEKDCALRAKAAVRLGELGDADAIEKLRELSEQPKDESDGAKVNCGQDEAAEAIRELKRSK